METQNGVGLGASVKVKVYRKQEPRRRNILEILVNSMRHFFWQGQSATTLRRGVFISFAGSSPWLSLPKEEPLRVNEE